MNNTLKQRYKNAIRFYNAEQNNTWMCLGQTQPWTNEAVPPISDRTIPQQTLLLQGAVTVNDSVTVTFSSGSNTSTFVASATLGSPTLTTTNTTGLIVGQTIAGTGIPSGTTVTAIVTNTSVTISQNATANTSSATYTVSLLQLVGSPLSILHSCVSGDQLSTIANDLCNKINANGTLSAAGVTATYDSVNFPNNVVIKWPNTLSLTITPQTSGPGTVTEIVSVSDLLNPVLAVKAAVNLVYEDDINGTLQFIDVNGNLRKFTAYGSTAAALAGKCLYVLAQATAYGSDFDTVASFFREVGFCTDLVPAAGQNGSVLTAAEILQWGDMESYENRLANSLTGSSRFTFGYIYQF